MESRKDLVSRVKQNTNRTRHDEGALHDLPRLAENINQIYTLGCGSVLLHQRRCSSPKLFPASWKLDAADYVGTT